MPGRNGAWAQLGRHLERLVARRPDAEDTEGAAVGSVASSGKDAGKPPRRLLVAEEDAAADAVGGQRPTKEII